MKILIIGSGLIGVTSAYHLARRGHQITVVDSASGPGEGASFANGTLLTPSMPDPWNAPGSWRVLLASLGRSDSPMQVRLRALPALTSWGIKFLRNSSPTAYERNTRSNLRLALYSLQTMEDLRRETGIRYGRTHDGTLRMFRDTYAFEKAQLASEKWVAEGLRCRYLSSTELVAFEPALEPIASSLAGGIHYEGDETGDAYRFCIGMREAAEQRGVRFRFHAQVQKLSVRSGVVVKAVTSREHFSADCYIIAAGSHSALLARTVRIALPVRPVKGYSITFDRPAKEPLLRVPVVDDALHAVVTPLENAIRVAGTAEFCGYDLALRPARIRNLMTLLHAVLPRVQFDSERGKPWSGLRPMSADGVPIIGSTPLPNLFVNTGHGHLGWTMAAGSARILADLICGEPPALDPTPFALARFLSR
jgi:D-amino-acid dehydrogenase